MRGDDPRFTFAVITDTHIRAPEGDLSSPYPVNDKANGRARYAVEVVLANQPDLTIHLGDMVHPLPHLPAYGSACDEARRILQPLEPALHFVPGNHDIGDKPAMASPAGPVTDQSRQAFEAAFGQSWHAFSHRGIRFVVVNSSLVNTGTTAEAAQQAWLEKTLSEAKDERLFLFSHYPPFITEPGEPEHYDNYAEPGRTWLLNLAADHGVEAIFSGHTHQFFFNRYRGVKLYVLPPTSFTRQDYAELYRGTPAAEFGRDDTGKFGITLIDVRADGHTLRFAPTDGLELDNGEKASIGPTRQPRTPIMPHLRHAWFEATSLPYNGPMEEFSRKRARNDYPLLRLWQLGIDTVRTPLLDLIDPDTRQRILDVATTGVRFSFFHLGMPDDAAAALLAEHRDLVDSVEIVSTDVKLTDIGERIGPFAAAIQRPVVIGKATTSAQEKDRAGGSFAHNVSYGFLWPERQDAIAAASPLASLVPRLALCFQTGIGDDPVSRIAEMASLLDEAGLGLVVSLRIARRDPATAETDDRLIAEKVHAAIELARGSNTIRLQCDTFEDIDRGYSPRHGFLDRHSNLRPVARRCLEGSS